VVSNTTERPSDEIEGDRDALLATTVPVVESDSSVVVPSSRSRTKICDTRETASGEKFDASERNATA
jgi:hypothetical protein